MVKRKQEEKIFELPKEIEIKIEENKVKISGSLGNLEKKISLIPEIKDNKIIFKFDKRKTKKNINSIIAHIKNMIIGVTKGYEYKLQICSVHFPINVSLKEGFIIVKNFLGETRERKARILNSEVKIEGDIITIKSLDKEAAGQTAANIETATRIRNKDRRIFQDGIFIIEKAGKKI